VNGGETWGERTTRRFWTRLFGFQVLGYFVTPNPISSFSRRMPFGLEIQRVTEVGSGVTGIDPYLFAKHKQEQTPGLHACRKLKN
jgi:hypothetical protein